MSEKQEYKHIREVFRDFNSSNQNIMNAKVKSINLFKKTNKLELTLISENYIEIKGIYAFEKYLEGRFEINNIKINIENNNCETTEIRETDTLIENQWNDIIDYMSYKHPMSKAILVGSSISIDNKNINVELSKKGRDFLVSKKFDTILSNIIYAIYGEKYKINYIENIAEDAIKKYQEYAEKMQEEVIRKAQEETKRVVEEKLDVSRPLDKAATPTMQPENSMQEQKNIQPVAPADIPVDDGYFGEEVPVPEEEYLQELEQMDEEEHYILGKPSKAKEKKVKIKEISADNKRITVEGRIVSCEARETKTGKGMIIFDIYDGTGIITCKSFTPDIKEGNEVAEKIRKASGIKVIGKAGLDAFAGDVTIMANIIVEINGDNFPKLPSEDEDSPLILGMNPEIKEPLVKIQDLGVESGNVCIDGEVIAMEDRELKGGKILLSLSVYDGTSTMTCKAFLTKENCKKVMGKIKESKRSKNSWKSRNGCFFK